MRLLLIVWILVLLPGLLVANNRHAGVMEDNDFAEFEESDDGLLTFNFTLSVFFTSMDRCIVLSMTVLVKSWLQLKLDKSKTFLF